MTDRLDVFGWLADHSGCGVLRIKQPLDALASQAGLNTYHDERMQTKVPEGLPKTIVGQRVCKDGPSSLWFRMALEKEKPRLVYEVDDDLWNVDVSNANAFSWFIGGLDMSTGEHHNVQTNLRRNIAVADAVTVTTEPLAEIVRQFNPNVHIIPNYIPRWVTEWERPKREGLTIGWGGSGTHNMDWEADGAQIRRFLVRNPDVRFRLIGAGTGGQVSLPESRVDATGWIDSVDGYWKAIDYDIGVIPLKHHVFNQSKSALKFLENSALGIPTVASDAGPYAREIEHGRTGFLVKRDHEWGKYLRALVNDEAMREEIGANAKAWAKTQVLEDHIGEWKAVLSD